MSNVKWEIADKEMKELLSSRKFLALFVLFALLNLFSVWMSRDAISMTPQGPEGSIIEVFRTLVNLNLPMAAGALGLILSYNSISRERESGTLELLLSYPVYRDEVVNGKFIAHMFAVSAAVFLSLLAALGFAVQLTGVNPSVADLVRLGLVWVGTVIYTGMFVALGTMLSARIRSSWKSLAAGALVLTLFLATPFLSGMAASTVYPYDEDADAEREQKREALEKSIDKFSPSQSYRMYVEKIVGSRYGNYDLKPSTRQAFNQASGYLIYLGSETMLAFTLAYAFFVRQDL